LRKINLALGIHNHQPVGNFDFVFEDAYQKAYLPFFEVHEKHADIKLAQHYSGILFEWIDRHHPEFTERLRQMVKRGSIEMMTGGYYEPILMTIPDEDKLGQIKKLTKYVKEKTGYDAIGAWLAERVWEPDLPEPVAKAGVKYTLIDDAHFKYTGLKEQDLYGYYLTEHNGHILNIFPISEKLRYTIPFRPIEETVDYLKSIATEKGDRLIVFADDGEKFGVWPHTYEQCYQNGWLESFFRMLEDNKEWIHIVSFREALEKLDPAGRVYLPTASYREMMEWALPSRAIHEYEAFEKWLKENKMNPDFKVFVRGGFWRNFLAKYPESNNMHKRMLRSSNRWRSLAQKKKSKRLDKALDFIYAGQCNCPYWHGIFGGLYLPHIRNAIYQQLIMADREMDAVEMSAAEKSAGWARSQVADFDGDGFDEVIVETERMNLFFAPRSGAQLFELDYKAINHNMLDTMTRREEGYHKKLVELARHQHGSGENDVASIHDMVTAKEEGLENYLNYDWYRRTSLVDHFFHDSVSLEDFARAKYREQGDFVDQSYKFLHAKKSGARLAVTFQRDGHVWIGSAFCPLQLTKTIAVAARADEFEVSYSIRNDHTQPVDLWFGTEFVFALLAGHAHDRYYAIEGVDLKEPHLDSIGCTDQAQQVSLVDEWLGINVSMTADVAGALWRFPIETISLSEAGFERVYQCSVVMPNWRFSLEPGEKWSNTIKQSLTLLK